MTTISSEELVLPSDYIRGVLNEIIKEENYQDNFKLHISAASAKGENYLGELFRIKVTGKKINSDVENSFSLVLKAAPCTNEVRECIPVNKVYKTEHFVYSKMQPVLDKLQEDYKVEVSDRYKHPKLYKGSSEEFKEVLFLEDMNMEGFKMFDRFKPLDYDHAKLVIKKLAAFHATSFVLKKKNPELFFQMAENATKQEDFEDFFEKLVNDSADRVIEVTEDEECLKRFTEYRVGIYDKLNKLLDIDEPGEYSILCHGDCWTNNFMFKYQDNIPIEMCMVDWQVLRLASPITDLAYFIFTSSDKAFRKKHLSDLFDLYHKNLSSRVAEMGEDIKECFPNHVFREHIMKYLKFGLIMAIVVIPFNQCERGKAPEITDVLKIDGTEKNPMFDFTEECKVRLRGVVSDFVEYGMI